MKSKPERQKRQDENYPDGLPDKFFNPEGELDLRKATGEELKKFFISQNNGTPYDDEE